MVENVGVREQVRDQFAVPNVAPNVLRLVVEVVGFVVVDLVGQVVEDRHLVALIDQPVDDVAADESRAAGHENARHGCCFSTAG